jgi:hypothetical protein
MMFRKQIVPVTLRLSSTSLMGSFSPETLLFLDDEIDDSSPETSEYLSF